MFLNSTLILLEKDNITCNEIKKGIFIKRLKIKRSYQVRNSNFQQLKIKSKNISFIILGEKIFIKRMSLPKINKNIKKELIINELGNYCSNDNRLLFSYERENIHENNEDVIVYSLNYSGISSINSAMKINKKIKGVFLIQFIYLNFYHKKIKEQNYIFSFIFNSKLYILIVNNNKLVYNAVEDFYEEGNLSDLLYLNIEKYQQISMTWPIYMVREQCINENVFRTTEHPLIFLKKLQINELLLKIGKVKS